MIEYEHGCYEYLFKLTEHYALTTWSEEDKEKKCEYTVAEDAAGRDFLHALNAGKLSFRFTREEYDSSVMLQKSIRALGLDAEKSSSTR